MKVLSFRRLSGAALLTLSVGAGLSMTTAATAADTNQAATARTTTTAVPKSPTRAQSQDGIIALVNQNAILKSDLAVAVAQAKQRAALTGDAIPAGQQLQSEVLNALILRELQLALVKRVGIKPDEEAVNARLAQIAQSQGMTSLTELQQRFDAEQPGSYARVRQQVIEEASIQALQQRQVASRVRITDQDIEAFLASPEAKRLNQSEYQTIHVRVPYIDDYSRLSEKQRDEALQVANKLYTALKQPNVDVNAAMSAVQGKYAVPLQGGNMGYNKAAGLPVQLANAITMLKVGEVSQPIISPEGIDVVKLADKKSADKMIIPQWRARHILIKVDDLQSEELAKQKINDLYEQLRRGADFASLAATYSDDVGSAGRGGDLDWVEEGTMVAPFEQMMKATPVGDYSTPFQTQFGWHIVKVDSERQQDVSEQYRRKMAQDTLYKRLAPQAQEDWLQELRAGAYVKIFDENITADLVQ